MMLTEKQIEDYHKNGFVVPEYRIPGKMLDDIREMSKRLVHEYKEFRDYCPTLLAYETGFLTVARHPQILDMVEQILGPNFALWNSSFFSKPANNGKATPWHQDGEYWPIRPMATCTAWLAIDTATEENGCLEYIPGSHTAKKALSHETNPSDEYTLNQELLSSEFDQSKAYSLELEAGQMALHDAFIVHGSGVNNSSNSRRGMTLRYMPTTSVFDRELAAEMASTTSLGHQERTLFLMRGIDACGKNDFRVRL